MLWNDYCTMTREKEGYYISNNGRALVLGISDGTTDGSPLEPPTRSMRDAADGESGYSSASSTGDSRERRDIPKVSDTGVVKLLIVPDKCYMDRFLFFTDGDVDAAKMEVTKFLMLAVNEMSMAYQSLRQYDLSMTIRRKSRTLDLAAYIADIVFPEVDRSGLGFVNPQWSEESLVDGVIQFRYDTGIGYNKGLESFRQWVLGYSTSIRYDHATALTGFPIHQVSDDRSYQLDGVSWIKTTCDKGSTSTGYHTSMVTLYGAQGRLLAHEVAHSLGSYHDAVSPCPPFQYLMSPSTVIPSADTVDTYYTMSSCSASNIRDHLTSIPSYDFVWTCLYDTSLSQSQFVDQYCNQGLKGDYFTLDEQCQLAYGTDSYVCSPKNFLTENDYVSQCRRETLHPLYCHRKQEGECMPIPEVADGTKCSVDGTLGTNICFKGNCVNAADMCSTASTVIVTAPPTPTTPIPTTTTTTFAPTTTTTSIALTTTTTTPSHNTTTTTPTPTTAATTSTTSSATEAPTTTPTTTTTTTTPSPKTTASYKSTSRTSWYTSTGTSGTTRCICF